MKCDKISGDETPVSALPSDVRSLQQHESAHPADARQDGRHTQVRQLRRLQQSRSGIQKFVLKIVFVCVL